MRAQAFLLKQVLQQLRVFGKWLLQVGWLGLLDRGLGCGGRVVRFPCSTLSKEKQKHPTLPREHFAASPLINHALRLPYHLLIALQLCSHHSYPPPSNPLHPDTSRTAVCEGRHSRSYSRICSPSFLLEVMTRALWTLAVWDPAALPFQWGWWRP